MNAPQSYNILDLLPQRPPFVMVDRLVWCDQSVTRTELLVREENLFCDGGQLSTAGICENMAQTCAARLGYLSLESGEPVRLGFIGSITNMEVYKRPQAGQVITTEIDVIEEVFNITLVHAKVLYNNELVAESNLKIALAEEQA